MAKKCVVCGEKIGMMQGTQMFGGQICLTCNAKFGDFDSAMRDTLAGAVDYFSAFQQKHTMEPEAEKSISRELASARERLEFLAVGDDGKFLETPVAEREKIAVSMGNRMLVMIDGAFVFVSGREETTVPFSQVISLRIKEPKNDRSNGVIAIALAGGSDTFVHLTSWLTVGSNNNIEFPLPSNQIEEAREMNRRFNAFHQSGGNAGQQTAPVSVADEIRKYKELLDMGAITEEEFAAAKKLLLKM